MANTLPLWLMTFRRLDGLLDTKYLRMAQDRAEAIHAREGIGPLLDSRELVRVALRERPEATPEDLSRMIVEDEGKRRAGHPHFHVEQIEHILTQIAG